MKLRIIKDIPSIVPGHFSRKKGDIIDTEIMTQTHARYIEDGYAEVVEEDRCNDCWTMNGVYNYCSKHRNTLSSTNENWEKKLFDIAYYMWDENWELDIVEKERFFKYLYYIISQEKKALIREHFDRINSILNKHSKSVSDGGLDYVKAFEEMEKYESELLTNLRKEL